MRKFVLILVLILAGCNVTYEQLQPQLEAKVSTALTAKTPSVLNQNTPFYSYYLPPHMGRRFSNHVATIFVSNDEEIVMNLDVPSIIMQRYYRNRLTNNLRVLNTDELAFFTYHSSYTHNSGETLSANITISEVDDKFTIVIQTDHFIFSSVVPLSKVEPVLYDMLTLMRSAKANRNEVVSAYSNKQVIDYQQQVLEIFEQVAPESGTLADMDRLISGNLDFSQFINEGNENIENGNGEQDLQNLEQ